MSAAWRIGPCPEAECRTLARELGLSRTAASVLVRRGYGDPETARTFLEGALPGHDPFSLGDMRAAVETIRGAVAARKRICVHGDYDADGICATALALFLLRELGAEPDWHLPSRFEEGYGLAAQTLTRLATEGVDLVLTVDCGITAIAEVDEARRLGLEVVVSDHHRPEERFPDCPVVAPLKGDYPFAGLCGTAVVGKLAQALLGEGHPFCERHLDLVALATIADVVPLLDESRALARLGLLRLARTAKPGLRALMAVAGVDPAACDEGAIGFRLAPRINAAGRLCRPSAALQLLLTEDEREAVGLARELEDLNRERQAVEDRILRAAGAEIEAWPPERRRRRGFVVAGADWHEGVIGIVASRLCERYGRPVVLIAGGEGDWKGSGRAGGSFDLHGGLRACAEHLQRFGGHRAAAGLTIQPDRIDAFAEAFAAHADAVLTDDDLAAPITIDAIVPGRELGAAPVRGSCRAWRRSGSGTPGSRCWPRSASSRVSIRWARASICASECVNGEPTPGRRSPSGWGRSSIASAAWAATTWPSGCRRTTGTGRCRPSWSSAGSSRPRTATSSSAPPSPSSGAAGRQPGRPRRGRCSPSSSWARVCAAACSSRSRSGPCSSCRRWPRRPDRAVTGARAPVAAGG